MTGPSDERDDGHLVTELLPRALAVIVGLDVVGLVIGYVLRRRRGSAAGRQVG